MSEKFCTTCGTVAKPKSVTRGSVWLELVLWLMFIIPGLLYSIWRLTTRHHACRACGAQTLVPVDSPVAKARLDKPAVV